MTTLDEFLRTMFITYLGFVGYEKYLELTNSNQNPRRCWVRDEYQGRDVNGFFERTFKGMKNRNSHEFFKATRMTVKSFDALLEMLHTQLNKRSVRKPIEPECRLALTLFYLANGDSRQQLATTFKMGVSTVASIIFDTCNIICSELSEIYLTGSMKVDWEKYAEDYNKKWHLPNCVGALGAKHIPSGTRYFNHRGEKSIALLAAANAENNFIAIDIITSSEDEKRDEEMSESGLGTLLNADYALPESCLLPNSDKCFPYYFVGEMSYPLKRNLIRPYPGNKISEEREHFNSRLGIARRSVENAFGILCSRWKVLSSDFNCTHKNFEKIVTACVVLHNFLKDQQDPLYCPEDFVDRIIDGTIVEGFWRKDVKNLYSYRPSCSNNASREAFALRDQLCSHLNSPNGKVLIEQPMLNIIPPSPSIEDSEDVDYMQPSSSQSFVTEPFQPIEAPQIHENKKFLINSDGNLVICTDESETSSKKEFQDIDIKQYKPITFEADQNGILTAAPSINTINVSANAEIVDGQVVSIAEININLA